MRKRAHFELELVNQLRICKDVIKRITEDNKTLQIKADTVDLMSCFLFARVPEPKRQGYGVDPIFEIDRLVDRYDALMTEIELNRQDRKFRKFKKDKEAAALNVNLKQKKEKSK